MRIVFNIGFLLSFMLGIAQNEKTLDKVIAVVGSEIVLYSELEVQYLQLRSQGAKKGMDTRCEVLDNLLFQKLLINQSKLDSVEVTEGQVSAEVDRRIAYFVSQIGSERALEEYYKKPIEEIRAELAKGVKNQMLTQQMQATITSSIRITPSEVKKYYKDLPKDSLPLVNAGVEVAQLVILAPASRKAREAAKTRLNDMRDRIKAGEDFATLAILYSEDPGTAKKGGELGFVGKAEVDPAFANVAFKLKGSEVSRIVESQFGFHIIQLIERRDEKVNVRHILIKPKIEGADLQFAKNQCDSLKNVIQDIDSLDFARVAIMFSEDEESKNNAGLMVNPYTGSSVFELDQLEPAIYVATEKMEPGDISDPLTYSTRDGKQGYRIIQLLTKNESHRANLKQDYQLIQNIALARKQADQVENWIERKIQKTHIKVNPDYGSCKFINPWI